MSFIAKILIVDDEPKYLKDVLPSYGYEVVTALDGINALKILKSEEHQFDLVLLDVVMPNMDGWKTLKAIRSDKATETLPVIMLTALDEDYQQISGLKFGADDYIIKPFSLPNLLARIEALLRRSKWKNENELANRTHVHIASNDPINQLTVREKEVLALVAKGASNSEIAEKLFVREVTVKTHLNNIFKKLNVTNRTQAVLLAMQLMII
jgi:two-component system alkaline phosphatase synthesis response regulator PhoP